MKAFVLSVLLSPLFCGTVFSQSYSIDISKPGDKVFEGHLQLGSNKDPEGNVMGANSLYFTRNGKPWFPVMGEFHFCRFPKAQWEESILRMKAAGIDVIATYIFWIYHEETEGSWDWSEDLDLRTFVALCKKHGIYVVARLGPWCHGEVRNGGFPDWLLRKKIKTRTNDSLYLDYSKILFTQINKQLSGLYFKQGGPVIGVQIENEFRFNNPKGLAHITSLLHIAKAVGIDVPLYTATGWPGSNIRQNELIPVWGGYPEAPWDKRTTQLSPSANYLFDTLRSDPNIGNDINGTAKDTNNYTGYRYPYSTAEIGGGIQITYHRRPIIKPQDVTALAYTKIGSGANLIGYYMFHGGHNKIGKLSSFQESKATGNPNDYPILNYDFQAPLGEWGQVQPSYKEFKALHLFLNDFGDRLAICNTYFPTKKPFGPSDSATLRWSIRGKDGSGFVFINNFQRQINMQTLKNVQLNIQLPNGTTLKIPEDNPIDIPANLTTIWPINMAMGDALLTAATAQPLCILHNGLTDTYVFFASDNVKATYWIDTKNITGYEPCKGIDIIKEKDNYQIKANAPGTGSLLVFTLANGRHLEILTLTQAQAFDSWKATLRGKERLVISSGIVLVNEGRMQLQNIADPKLEWSIFPKPDSKVPQQGTAITQKTDGFFSRYTCKLPAKKTTVNWKEDINLPATLTPVVLLKIKGADSANFSMPAYNTILQSVPGAHYYKIDIPKEAFKNSDHLILQIDYSGDTQALYADGKLIADNFYNGQPMIVALDTAYAGKSLVALVTPLTDDRKIFFEKGIREPLAGRAVAEILQIKILPKYEIDLTRTY